MGRVRLDNECGRDHKSRALQYFTDFFLELYACAHAARLCTKFLKDKNGVGS